MWRITKIANTAKKTIKEQRPELQQTIIQRFEALQENPFASDVKKIVGKQDIYRGRIGHLRYYFRLDFRTRTIEILFVKFRGKIKQKTIERLC